MVTCKSAGEADGKVPCPNNCLRLSVGNWTKDKDGLMVRRYTFGGTGAYTWFSEHHIGDVIVVDTKAKTATDAGQFPVCGGTTKIDDAACHGTGKVPCPECVARRSAGPCPNNCVVGRVMCLTCKGSGLKVKA